MKYLTEQRILQLVRFTDFNLFIRKSKVNSKLLYTLYGQSVTGTAETIPTASKRYLIKNGVIQENNGGWWMSVKGGNTGKYSISDGLLKIDTGYGSSVPDHTTIITNNPIYPLSTSALSRYKHLYLTFYIVTGNTKYNSWIRVAVSSSRDGSGSKEIFWDGFYAGDLKQTWRTSSASVVKIDDLQYPYLIITASSQSSSAHTEVQLQNLWYDEA